MWLDIFLCFLCKEEGGRREEGGGRREDVSGVGALLILRLAQSYASD